MSQNQDVTPESVSQRSDEASASVDRRGASRRRLLISGAAVGPLMVVMSNRASAWTSGTPCQRPSAWLSTQTAQTKGIRLSHQPQSPGCDGGRTCGYWQGGYNCKQQSYPPCSPQGAGYQNNCYTHTTSIPNPTCYQAFGCGSTSITIGWYLYNEPSSWQAVLGCAYLNAVNNNKSCGAGVIDYPLSVTDVQHMAQGTYTCNSQVWTVSECVSYVQSTLFT